MTVLCVMGVARHSSGKTYASLSVSDASFCAATTEAMLKDCFCCSSTRLSTGCVLAHTASCSSCKSYTNQNTAAGIYSLIINIE